MRILFFLTILILETLLAEGLKISAEKRFKPFVESLNGIILDEQKSSLDAFNSIKLTNSTVAIVRGDILVDNMASSNFFIQSGFKEYRVVSKLQEEYSTFLYLISKEKINNAYELFNPNPKSKKMKNISVGYLRDLSNIYLADIAKSVNSSYRFRYKSYSPEESLKKLAEGHIDSAYLFISKEFVQKAQSQGFIVQNILRPTNIKREKFAQKIANQKAFTKIDNGIRVDSYLIVSSTISDESLQRLIFTLYQNNILNSKIEQKYGEVESRIPIILAKEEICKKAKIKEIDITEKKRLLMNYRREAKREINSILVLIRSLDKLSFFKPQSEGVVESIDDYYHEAIDLIKDTEIEITKCNLQLIDANLIRVDGKIDEIKRAKKELAQLKGEILREKQQIELKEEEKREREQKNLSTLIE
jgi:hypothetical protein